MSTNTVVSIDIAGPQPLRRSEHVAFPVFEERRARPGLRSLIGGCLLQLSAGAWMGLDVVLACAGVAAGTQLFVWWDRTANLLSDPAQWATYLTLALSVVLAGLIFGLYEQRTLWSRWRITARCLLTVTLAMPATWAALHLLMYSSMSRRSAATGVVFYFATASLVRQLAHGAIRYVKRGLLVIGQGPCTGQIIRSVRRGSVPGYRLVGIIGDNRPGRGGNAGDIPTVGRIEEIERVCREFDVAEVVVADQSAGDPVYHRAAMACLRMGCRVTNETTFFETTYGEVPAAHIPPSWFLVADLKGQREEHALLKRIFDVGVAAVGMLASVALWPVIALAIRLESKGPVFYQQTRVGQGGRLFTLYKFRTMRGDAEKDGSTWATPDDPRVTRVGRFLRRSRLDELPQLLNILRGEMSLVGPRPERPEFVQPLCTFIPYYAERHLIKPGLTGWAQINYRYGSSVADARRKLQLDLYYIKHMSLELDLVILLRTFGTFFRGGH